MCARFRLTYRRLHEKLNLVIGLLSRPKQVMLGARVEGEGEGAATRPGACAAGAGRIKTRSLLDQRCSSREPPRSGARRIS